MAILHDQKTLPQEEIDPDQLLTELGFDSLDALNILFALEETFGITIPDEQARSCRTVREMTTTVEGLLPS